MKRQVVTNVPKSKVESVVQRLMALGAINIEIRQIPRGSGLYSISADIPSEDPPPTRGGGPGHMP